MEVRLRNLFFSLYAKSKAVLLAKEWLKHFEYLGFELLLLFANPIRNSATYSISKVYVISNVLCFKIQRRTNAFHALFQFPFTEKEWRSCSMIPTIYTILRSLGLGSFFAKAGLKGVPAETF